MRRPRNSRASAGGIALILVFLLSFVVVTVSQPSVRVVEASPEVFGYQTVGTLGYTDIYDRITGSVFTCTSAGTADSITAYFEVNYNCTVYALIYNHDTGAKVGEAEHIFYDFAPAGWYTFTFSAPKPTLTANTAYVLALWGEPESESSPYFYYNDGDDSVQGHYKVSGTFPDPITWDGHEDRKYSIYCTYTAGGAPPTQPQLLLPENNSTDWDNTPTFTWTRGSNADNHRIEVDNDSNCLSPIDNENIAAPNDNTWTKAGVGYALGTYYWRVVAKSTGGENASVIRKFTIAILAPTVSTASATLVEENTARLNANLTDTGGENCSRLFDWDNDNGVPYAHTENIGISGAGTYYKDLSGLGVGTKYYFRARAVNSVGTGTGSELSFSTKPEAPTNLNAYSSTSSTINLSWTKGDNSENTIIRKKTGSYPTSVIDGDNVYSGTGTSTTSTGLEGITTYYYRAWAWDNSDTYSDGYSSDSETTLSTDKFGYQSIGAYDSGDMIGKIVGSWFTCLEDAYANSITVYFSNPPDSASGFLYRKSDGALIGITEFLVATPGWDMAWVTFSFYEAGYGSDTSIPTLAKNENYYITIWSNSGVLGLRYDNETNKGAYMAWGGAPAESPWSPTIENHKYSIYCSYTPFAKPTKPSLFSPENGGVLSTFEWTLASNANYHRLLIDDNVDFSSPIENSIVAQVFYSMNEDGDIYVSGQDWVIVRTASSGTVENIGTQILIGSFKDLYWCSRGFLFFDTSDIPDDATISSAFLSLWGENDTIGFPFDIRVQNGQPTYPHIPLEAGDYYLNYYSGDSPENEGGSLWTPSFVENKYNVIVLNDNAKANWIRKDNITKLCLKDSWDIRNRDPDTEQFISFTSAQGTNKPKLTVTLSTDNKKEVSLSKGNYYWKVVAINDYGENSSDVQQFYDNVGFPPSIEALYITTMDNTPDNTLDVDTWYKFKAEVRDNDTLSDISQIELRFYENTKAWDDNDNTRNHYSFKWTRENGFEEVGGLADLQSITVDNNITGTYGYASTRLPSQHKTFYVKGRFWLFYQDDSDDSVYWRTSLDGISWSERTYIGGKASYGGAYFAVWWDGENFEFVRQPDTSASYRCGQPLENGGINWVSGWDAVEDSAYMEDFTIITDTNGYPWIGCGGWTSTTNDPIVMKSGVKDGTSWTTENKWTLEDYPNSTTLRALAAVVPLQNGQIYAVYSLSTNSGSGDNQIYGKLWNGSSWGDKETASTSYVNVAHWAMFSASSTSMDNNVYVVFLSKTTNNVIFVKRTWGVGWGNEENVRVGATSSSTPTLILDNSGNSWVFWQEEDNIYYRKRSTNGTWGEITYFYTESENLYVYGNISSGYRPYDNKLLVYYTARSSTPYKIKFAYIDLVNYDHLLVDNCTAGNDSLTTDNWIFVVKLDKVASPTNWDVFAKVTDNAAASDNEEYLNKFSVNLYISSSLDDASVSFNGNPNENVAASQNPTVATIISNENFHVQCKMENATWTGSGTIYAENVWADNDNVTPWNFYLTITYQTLYSSVGWGEGIQRSAYWFLCIPNAILADNYTNSIKVRIIHV